MNTFLKQARTEDNQKVAVFTGEGAYHGSTKSKESNLDSEEMAPRTLEAYRQKTEIDTFQATFPNYYQIKDCLTQPLQEEIKNDGVTFCWCPFDLALEEAGPVTKNVLMHMKYFLEKKKKFVYVDSKIQYFQKGDLPVDSKLWHIDGSIAVRDERAQKLGYNILHDMKARLTGNLPMARYLAYQSSTHSATEFFTDPVSVQIPDLIPSFDILDQAVNEYLSKYPIWQPPDYNLPPFTPQPYASIVAFDGLSLHRAVPATRDGWRLWIRVIETDHEVKLNQSIIDCYNTVFRTEQ